MGDALSFGRWLRHRRKALDLTQDELARRLGRATVTMRKLEADKLRPSKLTAERLAGELGVAPEDADAFLRFARDAPDDLASFTATLHAVERTGGPTRKVLPLPVPRTRFIGRERELAEVAQSLKVERLVTLAGPGGCGKTRLALEVARRFGESYPDGVWFVDLGPLADPTLVAPAVAGALGLRERPDQPVEAALLGHLSSRRLLLLLDNCEHLIDSCARLVATLLDACPDVRILATSRETLRLGGEVVRRVPPLATPHPSDLPDDPAELLAIVEESEAGALFVDRARAVQPGFALVRENARGVADICHRLDGIPLAIELAAARLKALSVEQMHRRLDGQFHLLGSGYRDALPRQRTLRATIDWSFVLLSVEEQRLFRRLAIFAGGFTLEAAESVCSGEDLAAAEILGLLVQLVDKSLVQPEHRVGAARYRMLETIRQYAGERLAEAGEAGVSRERHRDWCLALVEHAEPEWWGVQQLAWLNVVLAEYDNLRAALAWCREANADAGARLAGGLWPYWMIRGENVEGWRWLEPMLARAREPSLTRGRALLGAGFLCRLLDVRRARRLSEESLAVFREQGDRRGCGWARHNLGWLADSAGQLAECQALFEESVVDFRATGDAAGLAMSVRLLGLCAQRQAQPERARALYEQSLALVRELGDHWSFGMTLRCLGDLARQQGDVARSRSLAEEALATFRAVGDRAAVSIVLGDLGNLERIAGDGRRAREYLLEGVRLSREVGVDLSTWCCLCFMGILAIQEGAPLRGVRVIGAAGTSLDFAVLFPTDRAELQTSLESARSALGHETYARAWAEGQAMTLERVIADALSPSKPEIAALPRPAPRGGSTLPLTPREQTVASLVAGGLTNRQIAERLVVSRGTAETHVKNILQKLNFHARSEIAVWAERHGLLAATPYNNVVRILTNVRASD